MALLGALLVVPVAAVATDEALPEQCVVDATEVHCTFALPGSSSFTVPAGIHEITAVVTGAAGGAASTGTGVGGLGGRATATLSVTPGQVLQVNVGARGGDSVSGAPGAGGVGGGAIGGTSASPLYAGAGGGGASDLRTGSFGLGDRVLVGGGGGGASQNMNGGAGGGENGGAGDGATPGGGGTQTAGGANPNNGGGSGAGLPGSFGTGGSGANDPSADGFLAGGGGGGGGWFGVGGAPVDATGIGGGGGSGYGPTGVTFESGVRSGDGMVTITFDRVPQTVAFTSTPPTGVVVDDVYDVSATATSGLPVSFSIDAASTEVCVIDGASVTFTGVGTCTIWADQPGDDVYLAAAPVSQNVEVEPSPQTIEFTSDPGEWMEIGDVYEVTAEASSGLPVEFSVDPDSVDVCVIEDAGIDLIGAGECTVLADQPGDDEWAAAEQVSQTFGVWYRYPDMQITGPDEATVGDEVSFEVEAFGDPFPTGDVEFFYLDLAEFDLTLEEVGLSGEFQDILFEEAELTELSELMAGVLADSDEGNDDGYLGPATLDDDGQAVLTVDDLPAGELAIFAEYYGDDIYDMAFYIGGVAVTEASSPPSSTTTTTVVPVTTTVATGTLPKTGVETQDLMQIVVVLLVVGSGLLALSRRQERLERRIRDEA